MREIGKLPDQRHAQRLADYLLTLGIRGRVDAGPDGATLWVYDEDRREEARREFDAFQASPADPRYERAALEARRLAAEAAAQEKRYRKNVVDLRTRWQSPGARRRPVTIALVGISVAVGLMSNFGHDATTSPWSLEMFITPPKIVDGEVVGFPKSLKPTLEGQWWRLVTPIFLHFSLPHLLFNALALMSLGSAVEVLRGSWRMLALVLAIAVVSNVAQFYWSGPMFGGLSGVAFGLFGYIWMKSRFEPGAGFSMPQNTVIMFLVFMVLCFTGVLGPIANAAHTVGLAVGSLLAMAPLAISRR